VRVAAPGKFKVTVNYSTASARNTGRYAVAVADRQIEGAVTPTEKAAVFRDDTAGELTLPAGEGILSVRAVTLAGGSLMRLREVTLTPVP
jgi:hypothetical protein